MHGENMLLKCTRVVQFSLGRVFQGDCRLIIRFLSISAKALLSAEYLFVHIHMFVRVCLVWGFWVVKCSLDISISSGFSLAS